MRAVILLVLLGGLGTVSPLPSQTGASANGSIEGSVQLLSKVASRRPRIRVYGDAGAAPRPDQSAANEVVNVVLYLESPPPNGVPPGGSRPLAIYQEHEIFTPHVLAVPR